MKITTWTEGLAITEPMAMDGMPEELYRAYPAESQSGLKDFMEQYDGSPGLYKVLHVDKLIERETSDSMELGTAFHSMAFFGNFDRDSDIFKQTTITGRGNLKTVTEAAETLRARPTFGLITHYKELSLFAKDPASGLSLKGKLDFVNEGLYIIGDLKFVGQLEKFNQYYVRDFGLDLQAVFYLDLMEMVFGPDNRYFMFVAVSQKSPYKAKFVQLKPETLSEARERKNAALIELAKCYRENSWFDKPQTI